MSVNSELKIKNLIPQRNWGRKGSAEAVIAWFGTKRKRLWMRGGGGG